MPGSAKQDNIIMFLDECMLANWAIWVSSFVFMYFSGRVPRLPVNSSTATWKHKGTLLHNGWGELRQQWLVLNNYSKLLALCTTLTNHWTQGLFHFHILKGKLRMQCDIPLCLTDKDCNSITVAVSFKHTFLRIYLRAVIM